MLMGHPRLRVPLGSFSGEADREPEASPSAGSGLARARLRTPASDYDRCMSEPWRTSRAAWAAAALLGVAGCRSAPPCAASADVGTVRARTVENAQRALAMLAELRPAVEQALGERKDVAIEVWMGAMERAPAGSHGFTLRTDDSATIHLPDSADDERTTLAHELVHALRPAALEV